MPSTGRRVCALESWRREGELHPQGAAPADFESSPFISQATHSVKITKTYAQCGALVHAVL
jgi:hypothetical protein